MENKIIAKEYVDKNYVEKSILKKAMREAIMEAKGFGEEAGADIMEKYIMFIKLRRNKTMSDEEKKALERIDYIQDFIIENGQYNADVNDMEYFSRIVNLIEKQSKEIEELKKYKEGYKLLSLVEEQQHKIEKLINANDNLKKTKRIKNMEYVNQNYVSKDKIKAKIEEVDIQLQKLKDGLTGRETNFVNKNMLFAQKKVLQSLLEKE